jgi:hypothetical protein
MINELTSEISFTSFKEEVLKDYRDCLPEQGNEFIGSKGSSRRGKQSSEFSEMAKTSDRSPWQRHFKKEISALVTIEIKPL